MASYSKYKEYVQCKLTRGDAHLTAFLPYHKDFKVGAQVELKDMDDSAESEFWTIESVGVRVTGDEINRGWNNNI